MAGRDVHTTRGGANASIWERFTGTSPVLNGPRSNERSRRSDPLADESTTHTKVPADVRADAQRLATSRWRAVHVYRLSSGAYDGVTEDDHAAIARYDKRATRVAVIQPKLPSVQSLLRAMPASARTQAEKLAERTGRGVVLFYRRDGNYIAITDDDAKALQQYRTRVLAIELTTIEPPTPKKEAPPASGTPDRAPKHPQGQPTTSARTAVTRAPRRTRTGRRTSEPEVPSATPVNAAPKIATPERTERKPSGRKPSKRKRATNKGTERKATGRKQTAHNDQENPMQSTAPPVHRHAEEAPRIVYDRRMAQHAYYLYHVQQRAREFVETAGKSAGWLDSQELVVEIGPDGDAVTVSDVDHIALVRQPESLPFDEIGNRWEPILLEVYDAQRERWYGIADNRRRGGRGFFRLVNDVRALLVMPPERVDADVFDAQYFAFWQFLSRSWKTYAGQYVDFLSAAGRRGYATPNIENLLPPISSDVVLIDNINAVAAFADGVEARYKQAEHVDGPEDMERAVVDYLRALREEGLQPLHGMRDEPEFSPLVRTDDMLVFFTDGGREYYTAEVDGDADTGARVLAHPVSDLATFDHVFDIDLDGDPWRDSLWAFMPMSGDRETARTHESEPPAAHTAPEPTKTERTASPSAVRAKKHKQPPPAIDVTASPESAEERRGNEADRGLDRLEQLLKNAIK